MIMCGGVSALHTMHLHLPELIDLPRCIRTSAVSAATYLAPSIRVGGRAGLVGHGNFAHPSRGWDGPGHPLGGPGLLLPPVTCVLKAPPTMTRDLGPGGPSPCHVPMLTLG